MQIKSSITSFLSTNVARQLDLVNPSTFTKISEIRLRANKPMLIKKDGQEHYILDLALTKINRLPREPSNAHENVSESGSIFVRLNEFPRKSNACAIQSAEHSANAYTPTQDDIYETMERISQHSFYAFEAELAHGYITLPGGHRVGVAGQAVIENGTVRSWKHISAINIRVAHSVIGCANEVMPYIANASPLHTLIIAPPGCGKTTLLRDMIRQLSNSGYTIGLADERSEVAGCFNGIPQNDVGMRTDVIDSCPKAIAMEMLLRAMSPDIIAVDELGGYADIRAVETIANAGIKLLCTAHASEVMDLKKNPAFEKLLQMGIFERYVVLGERYKIMGVYDANMELVSKQQIR